jgi:hypothetical protein
MNERKDVAEILNATQIETLILVELITRGILPRNFCVDNNIRLQAPEGRDTT